MGVKVREKVKGSGEWWVFVNYKGKRVAKKVGSREAADASKVKLEEQYGTKGFNIRNRADTVTLRQFAEKWMSGHVEKNLKPASARSYRDNLDNAILPEFGAYPIDQIPRDEVKAFAFRLLERRHHKTEENPKGVPYSKRSVHQIIRTLSAVMGHAVEDGLATRNPAAMPGKFIKLEKTDLDLLTPEEGEMGDLLINALERHLVSEKAKALKEGRPLAAWVFPGEPEEKTDPEAAPSPRGPLPDDAINTIHDRCLRKAKLRLTRVHDARHCFASWNLSAGASLFWVSRQMGHSSIKVTADLYGKYIPTEDRTAANLLDHAETRNPGATTNNVISGEFVIARPDREFGADAQT